MHDKINSIKLLLDPPFSVQYYAHENNNCIYSRNRKTNSTVQVIHSNSNIRIQYLCDVSKECVHVVSDCTNS